MKDDTWKPGGGFVICVLDLNRGFRRKFLLFFLVISGSLTITAAPRLQRFEFQQIQMGTLFRLVFHAADQASAESVSRKVFDRIEELEAILSDYREDSELNQASRLAAERAIVISDDLFRVLERSLYFSRKTSGAFEITVKPLVDLWRKARESRLLPNPEALESAFQLVGFREIMLNPRTRSLRLGKKGMQFDLGGIAKGYAADEAFILLKQEGMVSVMVDAGGDIRIGLPPPGKTSWSIGDLSSTNHQGSYLKLKDCGIATSGDSYQFVEINGTRYSHIVDPKTGFGLKNSHIVTVIAPDAITADALATAFSIMPYESTRLMVEKFPAINVRIVGRIESDEGVNKKLIFSTINFPESVLP